MCWLRTAYVGRWTASPHQLVRHVYPSETHRGCRVWLTAWSREHSGLEQSPALASPPASWTDQGARVNARRQLPGSLHRSPSSLPSPVALDAAKLSAPSRIQERPALQDQPSRPRSLRWAGEAEVLAYARFCCLSSQNPLSAPRVLRGRWKRSSLGVAGGKWGNSWRNRAISYAGLSWETVRLSWAKQKVRGGQQTGLLKGRGSRGALALAALFLMQSEVPRVRDTVKSWTVAAGFFLGLNFFHFVFSSLVTQMWRK